MTPDAHPPTHSCIAFLGQVVSLSVSEGDRIEENQQLAVIEAMKMQNVLKAERSGVVSSILCKAGDTLRVDAVIMEFEFEEE